MSESLTNKQAFKNKMQNKALYMKEYYRKNRAKRLQYQKEYYEKNRAEILKYNKINSKRKQYQKEYMKIYQAKHKKRIALYNKMYRTRLKRLYYEWDDQKRAKEELARFTPKERRQYDLWEIERNKKLKETQKHTVY